MLITEKELQAQIIDIKAQLSIKGITPAENNFLREQLELKTTCLRYIQTNPTEEFLVKQIEDLRQKIERRMALFVSPDPDKYLPKIINKMKREHEKEHRVPELRKQLLVLSSLVKS